MISRVFMPDFPACLALRMFVSRVSISPSGSPSPRIHPVKSRPDRKADLVTLPDTGAGETLPRDVTAPY